MPSAQEWCATCSHHPCRISTPRSRRGAPNSPLHPSCQRTSASPGHLHRPAARRTNRRASHRRSSVCEVLVLRYRLYYFPSAACSRCWARPRGLASATGPAHYCSLPQHGRIANVPLSHTCPTRDFEGTRASSAVDDWFSVPCGRRRTRCPQRRLWKISPVDCDWQISPVANLSGWCGLTSHCVDVVARDIDHHGSGASPIHYWKRCTVRGALSVFHVVL